MNVLPSDYPFHLHWVPVWGRSDYYNKTRFQFEPPLSDDYHKFLMRLFAKKNHDSRAADPDSEPVQGHMYRLFSIVDKYRKFATKNDLLTSRVDPLIHTIHIDRPIVSNMIGALDFLGSHREQRDEDCLKLAKEYEETAKRVERGLYELKRNKEIVTVGEMRHSIGILQKDFENVRGKLDAKILKALAEQDNAHYNQLHQ